MSFLLMTIIITATAQDIHTDAHPVHHHEHHRNEIGIANSPVYFFKEKVFAYGLHMHYLHKLSSSRFALGIGYERIFDEHKHNTFNLVGSYRPIDNLSFNISPGIAFEDRSGSGLNFAMHAETLYEFEIGDFHIGPLVEFAYDAEDYHISAGLHIGFGF